MKRLFTFLALAACALAQPTTPINNAKLQGATTMAPGTGAVAPTFTVPSGGTLTVASGGSIIAASGSTVTGFGGGGGGGVSSFSAGNLSPLFTTSVASSTSTPALSFILTSQTANAFFGGPASGSSGAPTVRALVAKDVPVSVANYNVMAYGAAGTGSGNDATAIQAAIDACLAAGGGTVVFPAGNYRCTATLVFKNHIRYVGATGSAGAFGSIITYTGSSDAIQVNNPSNSSTAAEISVEWLSVAASSLGAGKACFADNGSTYLTFDHVTFGNASTALCWGLILDQSELVTIKECNFQTGTSSATGGCVWLVNGAQRTGGNGEYFTNQIHFSGCNFNGTTGIGVADDGGVAHSFESCNFNALTNHMRVNAVRNFSVYGATQMEVPSSKGIEFLNTKVGGGSGAATTTASIRDAFLYTSASVPMVQITNSGAVNFLRLSGNNFNTAGAPINSIANATLSFTAGNIQTGAGGSPSGFGGVQMVGAFSASGDIASTAGAVSAFGALLAGGATDVGSNRILQSGTTSTATNYTRFNASSSGTNFIEMLDSGFDNFTMGINNSGGTVILPTGTVGFNTTSTTPIVFQISNLEVARFNGSGLKLAGLASGRVPFASTGGLLVDASALTFNSGTGALSATSFTGSGTGLTGTAAALTAGTASAVAIGGITGLGTGIATAAAINAGSAGSLQVNNASGAGLTGFPKADVLEGSLFAADAGSTDTYVITLSPAITAYVTGAHYWFKANTANTGAATININSVGAKTIVKAAGGITTALADNDIRAGQWVDLVYDGTNMQMQSLLGNAPGGGGGSGSPAGGSSPQNTLGAFVIDTTPGTLNYKSISAPQTFTFSGAPAAGTWFSLQIHNTDTDFAQLATIPSSRSVARNKNVTTTTVPANIVSAAGDIFLTWYYDGSTYFLFGDFNGTLLPTGQWTTLYGYNAGASATGADFAAYFGYEAGLSAPSAGQSAGFGYQAGKDPGGYAGSFFGYQSGAGGGGTSAVGLGYRTLYGADRAGTGNIAIGVHAAETITTMSGTVVAGYHGLNGAGASSNSVVIGDHAAIAVSTSDNSIFLGPFSGVSRNSTLWIDGRGTSIGSHVPLIYGEFDNHNVSFNGYGLFGQTSSGSAVADTSAALEVRSTTKGFLPPRMTAAQRAAISSPATGLMVYQTDSTVGYYGYNGAAWVQVGPVTGTANQIAVSSAGVVSLVSSAALPGSPTVAGTASTSAGGVVTVDGAQTFTAKRVTARITTITSSATPTVNTDNCDCVTITALAAAITSMTSSLSGTPVNFDQLEYRIKDDGTSRAIAWGTSFVSGPTALPTATTISKPLHVWLEWDSVQSKWVCMATGSDA